MLYIKQVSSFFFLKTSLLPTQKKGNKLLSNIFYFAHINVYEHYLFKSKNSLNYVQFLFMIKSNPKQYFLSFLGFNVLFFKTVSTGKLLKKKKITY